MDEILIGEKKYVSSKRAAKITGYAKDYIGQLCREGRVPAQLVGRSWYVLESAIQDHRFGNHEMSPEPAVAPAMPAAHALPDTWESPRYEAAPANMLPQINRMQRDEPAAAGPEEVPAEPEQQDIHESWSAWFDHVGDTLTSPVEAITHFAAAEPVTEEQEPVPVAREEEIPEPVVEEESLMNVPIHVMGERMPEREFLAHQEAGRPAPESRTRRGLSRRLVASIQVVGVLLAGVSAVFAAIGSGYFDEYIISSDRASFIAGVNVYNK